MYAARGEGVKVEMYLAYVNLNGHDGNIQTSIKIKPDSSFLELRHGKIFSKLFFQEKNRMIKGRARMEHPALSLVNFASEKGNNINFSHFFFLCYKSHIQLG